MKMATISREDHRMNDRVLSQYKAIDFNIKNNIKSMNPTIHFLEALRVNPNIIYAFKEQAAKYKGLPPKVFIKLAEVHEGQDLENVVKVFAAYPESRGNLIMTANILGLYRIGRLLDAYRKDPREGERILHDLKRAEWR